MEIQNKELTERIIAAAIELNASGISFERQKLLPIFYREFLIGEHRLDLLVEQTVVGELKAISALEDIHFAIVRSYLKAANLNDALLLNFAALRLTVKRVGREYHPNVNFDDVVL